MVAEEMPAPIGPEFKLLYDQQNYGMPLPDALKEFARRVPLLDARFFVTAVLIQREAGGNLAEILDNIATVIRDRFRVKRQIRVISAHARMTGWVLIGVPPSLGAVLFIINPNHWQHADRSDIGHQADHRGDRPADHGHTDHPEDGPDRVLRTTHVRADSLRSLRCSLRWPC